VLFVGCTSEGLDIYLPPPPWIWSCTAPTEVPPRLAVRGANLIGFDSGEYVGPSAHVSETIDAFAAVGGNWIAVNFWWFQDHVSSAEIGPAPELYTISDAAIAATVEAAQARGLNVLLRPMVDLRDGPSRRFILPSPEWFESYRAFIVTYAQCAAEWSVAAYSIGAELALTEAWEPEWRGIVADVRAVYDGPLIYCASYDTASDMRWWDAVDGIGIDAYYAVAVLPDMDSQAMTCAWSYWLDRIERRIVVANPGKPIWLTEVGIRSARGAARLPWCYNDPCFSLVDSTALDELEQANYYRAVLLAAGERPWLEGIFWWAWNADPRAPYIGPADYTPQGKTAEAVLAEFWAHERAGPDYTTSRSRWRQ
jgi:hypothetical protein